MYVTKRFSEFKATPEASLQPPPEGPNSGYVVVKEEDDPDETCCWGPSCRPRVRDLPFPQNKLLTAIYSTGGENSTTYTEKVLFVPVINLPLSANRYYVVAAKGKHIG
jgi:Protein of unknown function (DUF1262)